MSQIGSTEIESQCLLIVNNTPNLKCFIVGMWKRFAIVNILSHSTRFQKRRYLYERKPGRQCLLGDV